MAYNTPKITGTANQIAVTQTSAGQTLSIASPTLISTQPAFSATLTGDVTNATGDGTNYALLCNSKLFDQATNFNTGTGIFTAPVGGKYLFYVNITLANIGAAHTSCLITLVNTSNTFTCIQINPTATGSVGGAFSLCYSTIASMALNDTVQPFIQVSGGTKVVTVSAGAVNTEWGGALIC